MEAEIQATEMERNRIRNSYPNKGLILASESGIIANIAKSETVISGDIIARVATESSTETVIFNASIDDLEALISKETTITASFCIFNQETQSIETNDINGTISDVQYNSSTQTYDIYITVDYNFQRKVELPITVRAKSESNVYYSVVPLSSIGTSPEGGSFVLTIENEQTIWGISYSNLKII